MELKTGYDAAPKLASGDTSLMELKTGYDAAPKLASFSSRGVPMITLEAATAGDGRIGRRVAAEMTPAVRTLATFFSRADGVRVTFLDGPTLKAVVEVLRRRVRAIDLLNIMVLFWYSLVAWFGLDFGFM